MKKNTQFRLLLPVIQSITAITFGGIGLWQRQHILSQRFIDDQTLWDTTAQYHVWPFPYRFAVVSNIPAFLTAGLIEWPVGTLWPNVPELIGFVLFVLSVPVLWFLLGSQLDRFPHRQRRCWILYLSFSVLSIAAIFTPGYIGYAYSGCLLWVAFLWGLRVSVVGR